MERLERLAILSGGVLAVLTVGCFAILAVLNQLSSNVVDPADVKYTEQQMYYVGLFNFIGCGVSLLLLSVTIFYRVRLRSALVATGRLPLPVIVMVGLGYTLTFYFNGSLVWAFYANVIPFDLIITKWYYNIFLVFPNYLCRPLSSLPITATMLRITSIYFGVEQRLPNLPRLIVKAYEWFYRRVDHAWVYVFVFVMILPCITLALYDSIDVMLTTVMENNEQVVSYLISLFWALLCDFLDLWQVFCMFLLRGHLKRFDLDNSKILVVLSSLYLANSVLAYIRVATTFTNYLFSHILYTTIIYCQVFVLYIYSYSTMVSMLRRGNGGTTTGASASTTFVTSQSKSHFHPVQNDFVAGTVAVQRVTARESTV